MAKVDPDTFNLRDVRFAGMSKLDTRLPPEAATIACHAIVHGGTDRRRK